MNQCPRCHRAHTGICGIPAGVTLGFGARRTGKQSQFSIVGKPKVKKMSTSTLEILLVRAKRQLKKAVEMLTCTPIELPKYEQLLDRESKLNYLIKQLEQQIAVREQG